VIGEGFCEDWEEGGFFGGRAFEKVLDNLGFATGLTPLAGLRTGKLESKRLGRSGSEFCDLINNGVAAFAQGLDNLVPMAIGGVDNVAGMENKRVFNGVEWSFARGGRPRDDRGWLAAHVSCSILRG
jgi:hypothetical protein